MAITVTSKYKPFTYEELVKPLEGYWDKYDKEEAKLQEELNDLAKLKAIVDTAPEDNADRQKFDKLYKDFQNSVDILAERGLSIDNKNLFRALRQEYNAQVPRILVAEEDARKAKQEFMKLQNSGKYITPNNNNPGSFTWANYLDGNIPVFDPAVLKQEVFNAAAQQAEKITKRVTHDPTVDSTKLKGYTAITQKQGLKFENIDEMMANPLMQETYKTIRNSFDTEGWDEASINALDQEIKAGMFKGTFYDEKTDYQKNVSSSSNPYANLDPFTKKRLDRVITNQLEHEEAERTGANTTSGGNNVRLTSAGDRVVSEKTDERIFVPFVKNKEKDIDKQLDNAKSILYTIRPIDSYDPNGFWVAGKGWGQPYEGVPDGYYTVNPENAAIYLKAEDSADGRAYTRIHAPYHDHMINIFQERLDEDEKAAYNQFSSSDEYLAIVVGKLTKDSEGGSRYLLPIRQLVETLSTLDSNYQKIESGLDFVKNLGTIPNQIKEAYETTDHAGIVDKFNNEVLYVFDKKYLKDFEKSVAQKAAAEIGKLGDDEKITDKQQIKIYSEEYAKMRDEILNALPDSSYQRNANGILEESPGLRSLFKKYFDTYEKNSQLIDPKASVVYRKEQGEKIADYGTNVLPGEASAIKDAVRQAAPR